MDTIISETIIIIVFCFNVCGLVFLIIIFNVMPPDMAAFLFTEEKYGY